MIKKLEDSLSLPVYPKRPIVAVRGQNASVFTDDGVEYIDCMGGNGVASVGHCNPAVTAAIKEQAEKLLICAGTIYNDARARFLEKLDQVTPKELARTFICNSGTESIEGALKFARYVTRRPKIVTCTYGFHGRSYGALSLTYKPKYREGFEPFLEHVVHVPFNDPDALEACVDQDTCAIVFEPVQGEGGINPVSEEFIKRARELADRHDALLILDEVQSGFCRTGKFFAFEHYGVVPDVLCLAKAMGAGVPIGAIVCNDKVQLPAGKHGSTYGGFPLPCAAATAAINFMQENKLDERAAELGAYFKQKFEEKELAVVKELRQIGLMIGVELTTEVPEYLKKLMDERVLALPAGMNVIRLLPPLTIEKSQLDSVVNALHKIL